MAHVRRSPMIESPEPAMRATVTPLLNGVTAAVGATGSMARGDQRSGVRAQDVDGADLGFQPHGLAEISAAALVHQRVQGVFLRCHCVTVLRFGRPRAVEQMHRFERLAFCELAACTLPERTA